MLEQSLAVDSRLDAASLSIDEAHTEGVLEIGNSLRNDGLRDSETNCCLRHAARFHNGEEHVSIGELVAFAKTQSQGLNFSSAGFGTPSHLIGEMFKRDTGMKAVHVPYQQMPQAVSDLLNSTNHFMFIATLPVIDLINSGKLKALAVTSPKRIETLKDVPTVIEQDMPSLVVEDWLGFAVKTGTPMEILSRLNEAINRALKTDRVRVAFAKLGAEAVGGSPEDFGNLLRSQTQHWANVIKEADIKVQR